MHTKFFATGVLATKRGERFIGSLKKEAESAVLKYEEQVGRDENGKSYVMGYEESKLLVGFHYETPNNTLCTFWRHGEKHVPLFARSGNQRISLQEIINKRKKKRNNAYKIASVEVKNESQ